MNSEEYKQEKAQQAERERIAEELRKRTACFTGHRPDRYGHYDIKHEKNKPIISVLTKAIEMLIEEEKISRFISGGALGVDTLAFFSVHKLKEKHPNIQNLLAVPFDNQDRKWSAEQKKWYRRMLQLADEVIYVDTLSEYTLKDTPTGEYHPVKLQKRNEYMIDHAYAVIAVWDGSSGGTGNCVRYARKTYERRVLFRIDPRYDNHLDVRYIGHGI
ncbi:SLOG family protein [Brevibacillus brevis]|uniref:SLOG family protein n=1 Tax=Brevibacillus brevis TaxID=1393 RepID=UPI0007D8B2A3|nr:SLOG family protein [Brevibacillus brevis]